MATKGRTQGFTLVELMVALVVSALAALAIYGTFMTFSNTFTQTKSQNNAWQQARTAMALITQVVESAGYGLPMYNCSNGIYTGSSSSFTNVVGTSNGSGLLSLVPVAASAQISPNYVPAGTTTYALTVTTGGGVFGTSPVAHITQVPHVTAADMKLDNGNLLTSQDLFLVAMPNSTCILGQITQVNGSNNTNVVADHGVAPLYNAPGGFAAADPGVTAQALMNAGVINLGKGGFYIDNFWIEDQNPNPNANVLGTVPSSTAPLSVPSLYMVQYNAYTPAPSVTQSPPLPMLVARGIVDMQVEFGYGTQGVVTSYQAPGSGLAGDVLAVKIALLARSTRTVPGLSPNIITLMGTGASAVTYTVPTGLPAYSTMGCVNGNCRHYLYHVFKTVIPVRNAIWNQ
ncbi:MAG: PilW family protein [bacterium]